MGEVELCFYCGTNPADVRDHVVPRSQGGAARLNNTVSACSPCNWSKGGRTPEQWLISLRKRAAQCNHACPRCCGSASINPMTDHHRLVLRRLEAMYGRTHV